MRRSAKILAADRVSVPNSGEDAIRIETDFPQADECAFYLRPDNSLPIVGRDIAYGDQHTWYIADGRQVEAWKVGYNFDPDAPLR